jgi:putative Mn2+ efflux pump MntP
LAVTGFATSIYAMAVGAGLAFIEVNIFSTAITIGFANPAACLPRRVLIGAPEEGGG